MQLNRDILEQALGPEPGEGLRAEFDDDGLLVRLGVYMGGECISPLLELGPRTRSGCLTFSRDPVYGVDCQSYRNGTSHSVDAWSDNSRGTVLPWEEWVCKWVRVIEQRAAVWDEEPPLCRMARLGAVQGLESLLTRTDELDLRNARGMTAVHEAVARGEIAMLEALASAGARLEICRGITSGTHGGRMMPIQHTLGVAVEYQQRESLRWLLEQGLSFAPPKEYLGESPLVVAVEAHDVESLEILLEAGLDPNERHAKSFPLAAATAAVSGSPKERGPLELLTTLLKYGADPSQKGGYGWAPLHLAIARKARVKVLNLLIRAGADIDAQTSAGWTPLWLAVDRGRIGQLRALLRAGASKDIETEGGETPLDLARRRHKRFVPLLEAD